MAARFAADAHAFTTSVAAPSTTAYTVTWWAYLVVNRGVFTVQWETSNGSGTFTAVSMPDGDTYEIAIHTGGNDPNFDMATDTWYCLAITQAAGGGAGSMNIRWGTTPSSLSLFTRNGNPASCNLLTIGASSPFPDEFFNGRVASFKQWSAVLTPAEIATELGQYPAARTSGLVRRHDFKTATGFIDEGTGGNLSGGTGATTEPGPPLLDTQSALILPRRRNRSPTYRR